MVIRQFAQGFPGLVDHRSDDLLLLTENAAAAGELSGRGGALAGFLLQSGYLFGGILLQCRQLLLRILLNGSGFLPVFLQNPVTAFFGVLCDRLQNCV